MSPIISKNKYFILTDNGNTNTTSVMNARQPETIYPQSSNESNDNNNSNNNLTLNNGNSSEGDGEWVVKASVKRQPRRRPPHHNTINTENENQNYLVEDDSEEEEGYMSWTEHELSKHVKATQLKNIRTHPGVPLAVRRSLK